jgi:amino acid transporter
MTASSDRRRFGLISLTAIVVANMIGAGIFTTTGFALSDLGSPERVMWAWVVGGVIAVLGVLCYGALARHLQISGGEYLFLSRTIGPRTGFLAGWISLWAGFSGAIAVAAETLQAYLQPYVADAIPPDLIGSVLILLLAFLHAFRLQMGALLQNFAVTFKVILLVVLAIWGAMLLPDATADATSGAVTLPVDSSTTEIKPWNWGDFAMVLMWVSLSYSGWNAAVYVAGEAKDAKRNIPRAMLLGTMLVTALYLALNWVFVHAAPVEQLTQKGQIAAIAATATAALGSPGLEQTVRLGLALAMLTSISSMIMIGPRIYAQMADDGVFPKFFSFRGHSPSRSIFLQAGLAIALLWGSGLREQLTNLGWLLSICTAVSVVGLLLLRRDLGPKSVPIPGYPFVPLVFLAAIAYFAIQMAVHHSDDLWPAAVVLVSGGIAAVVFRPRA